ncbi:MAG: murein hydrolase activator EnvC family protein [Flavobacteriaceae bacterium]
MKSRNTIYKALFVLSFLLGTLCSFSQNNKQKELETRRQELRREIQKINALQAQGKTQQKSQLSLIEEFNHKITVLDDLIKVTNQQANLLTRNINANQDKISQLRNELEVLKTDYAAMVVKSYKNKNQQSRIMFLLSANNFKQAYKRLQYMQQYADYQKQQGEDIKAKTTQLQAINTDLLKQKEEKNKLIAENKQTQTTLEAARKQHQEVMKTIQKNLSLYATQIKQKQQEADRIDAEIDRIIKAAIAKSNKKAGKTETSKNFALTAEEKVLANNFAANKGKLPWPVERGFVTLGYGTQRHPLDKTLTMNSIGVRIKTEKGAKVRAVFNGEVLAIVNMKHINPVVMVKHGNYITAYKNLSKVYVKEGDKITTKQALGEVFTNTSGETILGFSISKDGSTQNPASWIYKM